MYERFTYTFSFRFSSRLGVAKVTELDALAVRAYCLDARIALAKLRLSKNNPCHVPSGPAGGQFCETKGGGILRETGLHGTTVAAAEKIVKEGIKPGVVIGKSQLGSAYVGTARDPLIAIGFAWKSARQEYLKRAPPGKR